MKKASLRNFCLLPRIWNLILSWRVRISYWADVNYFEPLKKYPLSLAMSPTTLQWGDDVIVDDYQKKPTKKAGAFLTPPLSFHNSIQITC